MSQINQVLATGEKILWHGKPQFLPYTFATKPKFLMSMLWFPFMFVLLLVMNYQPALLMGSSIMLAFLSIHLIHAALSHYFVEYFITDKRVLFQSGIIGRDFTGVEHDKITSLSVNVGLLDKIFGRNSGSILITHSGSGNGGQGFAQVSYVGLSVGQYDNVRPTTMIAVTDPQAVYTFLSKTSHDVRTDIAHPNAFRPQTNPGYTVQSNH